MTITTSPRPQFKKAVTEDTFPLAMLAIQANDEIAIDTETSGLDVRNGRDYLMGICISVEGWEGYLPFRHKEDNLPLRFLEPLIQALEYKILDWHNMKFDYHSFKTIGVDPLQAFKGEQYDCLILAHLVNEEWYSKQLDALSKMLLGEEKIDKEIHEWAKHFGYANLPVWMIDAYGAQDASLTRRLKPILWQRILQQELQDVYLNTEQPFAKLLYLLEQRGVGTRPDFCSENAERGRSRMSTILRQVGFNPASPNEIGKYLLDELGLPVLGHTDSCIKCKQGQHYSNHDGKASFNKRVMEEYDEILQASNDPTAKLVAEYRGWQKAVTSLYEPILERVGPDGLIRTDFKQHGTVTGRLSAQHPNLQQVPRNSSNIWNGRAKYAFHSGREDFLLYGYDYSQLELRLAAAYGNEALLLAEFEQDEADPFAVLAPLIFGSFTPEFRQETKTFVYANLYGAGLKKIAAQLGRPLHEVEGLYANYHNSIPGIMDISKRVSSLMEQRGFVRYWDGRRRHIRDKRESYKAWNSLCQGGGAQLVKRAMLRCQEFEDENCFMVLQVHDEITFCIRQDLIPKYEPLIVRAMTDFPEFGVRFKVEGKEWK